ncbi:MAG: LytR C-terminal domain-containing protein [Gemmatimonadota bacterium]|nr:LytR C-terminal domain-containing protein [Gemmatimonadota bacterium]
MTSPVPPLLHDEAPPHFRSKRTIYIVLTVMCAIAAGTGLWWWWRRPALADTKHTAAMRTPAADMDTLARAPLGVRIRVRVVNATPVDGLAKRATALLRDSGFDVVDYDTDRKNLRETTLVQTNTGHADWSERVHRALGVGTVEARPDSSRYVDITVLIGSDWKPPTEPFRP